MKYLYFTISFLFFFLFFSLNQNRVYAQTSERCLGFSVMLGNAHNWDPNQKIKVSCQTSSWCQGGQQVDYLGFIGDIATVSQCDCQIQNTLKVDVPSGCNYSLISGSLSGTNADHEQTPVIDVTCPAPPKSCQCAYPENCTTSDGKPGLKTCSGVWSSPGSTQCVWDSTGGCNPNCGQCNPLPASSTPVCTTKTTTYDQCANCAGTDWSGNKSSNITKTESTCGGSPTYKCNSETNCPNGCDTNTGKCKGATATPSPTPPFAECSTPSQCEQTSPSCRRCDVNGHWQKDFTCGNFDACCNAFPNTPGCPTPTTPGGRSPTPGVPTNTPTLTPTPTPDFNEAMCECDSIETTPIISGQKVTFTTFGKVVGTNTSKAKIESMEYFLGEETDPTHPNNAHIVDRSGAVPAQVVANSASLVRYKTTWDKTMMSSPGTNNFRLWTKLKCVRKTTAMASDQQRGVLAAVTSPFSSWWNSLTNSFSSLFGGPTPTPRKNLQLETFYPAKTIEKTCQMIRFKF